MTSWDHAGTRGTYLLLLSFVTLACSPGWPLTEVSENDLELVIRALALGLQVCTNAPSLYSAGIKPRALSMPGKPSGKGATLTALKGSLI